MPNYYNQMLNQPYGYAGQIGGYNGISGATGMMNQPVMNPMDQNQSGLGIRWVDGEVGARAFQMPAGWPAGAPIALWDTNDTVIYWKSINQMGMPNPLQKLRYTIEQTGQTMMTLPAGQSGAVAAQNQNPEHETKPAESNFVTKEDFDKLWKEVRNLSSEIRQNGSTLATPTLNNGRIDNKGGRNNG